MTEVVLKNGTEFVPVNEAARLIAEAVCPATAEETALFVGLHKGGDEPNAEAKERALNYRNARINVMNAHYHEIIGLIQTRVLKAIRLHDDETMLPILELEKYLKLRRIELSFADVVAPSILQEARPPVDAGVPLPNLRLDEWPLAAPRGQEPLSPEQLKRRLRQAEREAKYLLPARIMKGSKGKNGASAWNPAILANILTLRNDLIPKQAETMIADLFPDYLEEWKRLREREDTYSDK